MTLNLYNTSDAPNRINKTLGQPSAFSGMVVGEVNVINPVIDVSGTISGFNYADIPEFGRKYFIEEMRVVRTGITRITLKCDPLTSFAAQITALPCIAIRTAKKEKQSPYIFDSKRPMAAYQVYKTFELFTFTGMGSNVILVTVG